MPSIKLSHCGSDVGTDLVSRSTRSRTTVSGERDRKRERERGGEGRGGGRCEVATWLPENHRLRSQLVSVDLPSANSIPRHSPTILPPCLPLPPLFLSRSRARPQRSLTRITPYRPSFLVVSRCLPPPASPARPPLSLFPPQSPLHSALLSSPPLDSQILQFQPCRRYCGGT